MRECYCVFFLLFLLTAVRAVHGGEYAIELVEASPTDGFNFPYILRVPKAVRSPAVLIVETNNTGNSDDPEEHRARTLAAAKGNGLGPLASETLSLPLLMPVFPRPKTEWQLYTHALDRDTLLIDQGPLQRLDLQLLAMMAHAQGRLEKTGLSMEPRVMLVGFSASGTFANRFAFLHPTRFVGVVSGAVNATPMLPIGQHGDHLLRFPLGVHDVKERTGKKFDEQAWQALPQLIFMGAADDNDAVKFDDAFSDNERQTVFSVLGEDMGERWRAAQAIYLAAQANVTFVTYGQVGHWTNRRIHKDILNFAEEAISKVEAE